MSVFKTLFGALDNVQSDISQSFKSLKIKGPKKSKILKQPIEGVDIDAGADFLNKFQDQWEDIHKHSEENAEKAEKVDNQIAKLYIQCERQNTAMNQLLVLAAGLPQLLTDINHATELIEKLETEFDEVLSTVCELENIHEENAVLLNKKHHEHQLKLYKERKNMELEQTKVKLAQEHASTIEGYEAKLQEKIQERQQVFEDAFKEEMINYKLFGKTLMKPQLTDEGAEDLASIKIEEDTDALNDFLASAEHSESDKENSTSNFENHKESESDEEYKDTAKLVTQQVDSQKHEILENTNNYLHAKIDEQLEEQNANCSSKEPVVNCDTADKGNT